jgi:hypothetical protein
MTRRSDLMCEDLFGCSHEGETPIVQDGQIVYWRCRCGRRVAPQSAEEQASSKVAGRDGGRDDDR